MKLSATRLAAASVLVTAATWTLCALLVAVAPGWTMSATEGMLHADFSGAVWHLTAGTYASGLIMWSVVAGFAAALLAWTYNRLGGSATTP